MSQRAPLRLIIAMLVAGGLCASASAGVAYSLEDFDDATDDINDFFGSGGVWADAPSSGEVSFPTPGADGMGHFLAIRWTAAPGSAGTGWWTKLRPDWDGSGPLAPEPRDLSGYESVRFRLQGTGFGQGVSVWAKLAGPGGSKELKLAPAPGGTWRTYAIDLSQFGAAVVSAAAEFGIFVSPPAGGNAVNGRLHIDEVRLISNETASAAGDDAMLDRIERRTFDHFVEGSYPGTGLVWDSPTDPDRCSIAAVGCALAALPIGVERNWISRAEVAPLAERMLRSIQRSPKQLGLCYRYLNSKDATPEPGTETSTVDTAILLAGALCARSYFGKDSAIGNLAETLYRGVDWPKLIDPATGQFYTTWPPTEKSSNGKQYWTWDYYTDEVVLICLLAIGSPNHPVPRDVFWAWQQEIDGCGGAEGIVKTWFGSLFTYFVAGLWIDLRGLTDYAPEGKGPGVEWWHNSWKAARANRRFCRNNAAAYPTYGGDRWGLTACVGPSGYDGDYGALPDGDCVAHHDGTLAPCAAAMSLPAFKSEGGPNYALQALREYDGSVKLRSIYGLRDGFNYQPPPETGISGRWYSHDNIGLNEGFTIQGIENFRTERVWSLMDQCEYVQKAVRMVYGPPTDARIRLKKDAPGNWVGNDIYESSGTGQRKRTSAAPGRTAVFQISVQNDWIRSDRAYVRGSPGPKDWTVTYRDKNGKDITKEVTKGRGWQTPPLAPGEDVVIRLAVTVAAEAQSGHRESLKIMASTVAAPTYRDAVKAIVRVRKVRRPDALVKKIGETPWTGDGVYNDTGKQQTRSADAPIGGMAAYRVRVENDGNGPDSYNITGWAGGQHWRVRYFDAPAGGDNITAQVTGGAGWPTATLGPGEYRVIRVQVQPRAGAADGSRKALLVTATSASRSARLDVVRMITTAVSPTSSPPRITGLSAAPTAAGAQVVVSLSRAARVDARVLNIAGRRVCTLLVGRELAAGANTIVWNGRSDAGVRAPSGTYIVELVANDPDGGRTRALTPLRLRR